MADTSRHSTVLVISQVPPPVHGSTVMTQTFLSSALALGVRTVLIDRRFSHDIADVGRTSLRKLLSALWLVGRLARATFSEKPDGCVFFITNRPASFLVDWVLSEVLRLRRVQTVNYIHTVGYRELAARGRAWSWMVGRLLGSAEITICLSRRLVDDIAPWVDHSRSVEVIPNTPRANSLPTVERRPVVLFLSNLIAEKGADEFLALALALAPRLSGFEFLMAGATPDSSVVEDIVRSIEASTRPESVRLLGAVDSAEKWELLASAALLVFPSRYRYEAQPLTIIEALACGTPVVAYDTGAIADLVPSDAGVIVPQGDMARLRSVVEEIARSAEMQVSMQAGARRAYESGHSEAVYLERWHQVFRRMGWV